MSGVYKTSNFLEDHALHDVDAQNSFCHDAEEKEWGKAWIALVEIKY